MELLLILLYLLQSLIQPALDGQRRADSEARLQRLAAEIVELAADPAIDARALATEAEGRTAAAAGEWGGVRAAVSELLRTHEILTEDFDVRVVTDPTAEPGIWRVPIAAPTIRNYYLIVEAVAPQGNVLTRTIMSEEYGTVRTVVTWGVRVSEETWNTVAEDLFDDGVIQNDLVGEKQRGEMDIQWLMPVLGGEIHEW